MPAGTVAYFNRASCPSGWSALASAQGRFLVGLPAGGTLAGTVGSALANLGTIVHTHSFTATGTVAFGQFTNQIEYQNAGSALNNEMKKTVLAAVDANALAGKTVSIVGAFRLINPKSWLVTPVRLEVQ